MQSGCTSGCTNNAETVNGGTVEALAVALLALSSEDRARLAAMLATNAPVPDAAPGSGNAL
jgi:hypothetical protein